VSSGLGGIGSAGGRNSLLMVFSALAVVCIIDEVVSVGDAIAGVIM